MVHAAPMAKDVATVWHYAGCGTCKKALKWLDAHGVAYDAIPIVDHPPDAKTLRALAEAAGVGARKLVNVSGESYRALIASRGKPAIDALDDDALYALLARDGKMIKRPLLRRGDTVLVGFDEARYADALKGRTRR